MSPQTRIPQAALPASIEYRQQEKLVPANPYLNTGQYDIFPWVFPLWCHCHLRGRAKLTFTASAYKSRSGDSMIWSTFMYLSTILGLNVT